VVNPDGKVIFLTDKQIEEYCEKVGLLYKDTFIYYGTVKNYLEKNNLTGFLDFREPMLADLEIKYNEKDCYMCNNKVPEEGIILRKENMYSYEAYKLKSKRFILGESDAQEKGETNLEDNQE
jgi:ABC-type multidrug transport system ATPase subunit